MDLHRLKMAFDEMVRGWAYGLPAENVLTALNLQRLLPLLSQDAPFPMRVQDAVEDMLHRGMFKPEIFTVIEFTHDDRVYQRTVSLCVDPRERELILLDEGETVFRIESGGVVHRPETRDVLVYASFEKLKLHDGWPQGKMIHAPETKAVV